MYVEVLFVCCLYKTHAGETCCRVMDEEEGKGLYPAGQERHSDTTGERGGGSGQRRGKGTN